MSEAPRFIACDTCKAKQGMPVLCAGCLSNRTVIERLLAPVTRWTHIDDDLPPIGQWVLVGGHYESDPWWLCAERVRRNGNGWEWQATDDDPPFFDTLEYWAPVSEPAPTRRKGPT